MDLSEEDMVPFGEGEAEPLLGSGDLLEVVVIPQVSYLLMICVT